MWELGRAEKTTTENSIKGRKKKERIRDTWVRYQDR
jgi:hypothetical protein